jgi:hypothetical protein
MTLLVRRFIKTGIGFLATGLLLGLYMLVRRELFDSWPGAYLVSAHTHAVFVGFVMFMILGVALWLFPKPLANDPRYRTLWIETGYWLLLCVARCCESPPSWHVPGVTRRCWHGRYCLAGLPRSLACCCTYGPCGTGFARAQGSCARAGRMSGTEPPGLQARCCLPVKS